MNERLTSNNINEQVKSLDIKIEDLKKQLQDPKLTPEQVDEIKKSISTYELEKKSIQSLTIFELVKEQISRKNFNLDFTKDLISSIEFKEIPKENKPYIIWMILSWLNQEFISIKSLTNSWFALEWTNNNSKQAQEFEEYLNKLLNDWVFSVEEVRKWLLFRTTWIDDLLKDKLWKNKTDEELKKLNPKDLFQNLLQKYWIIIDGLDKISTLSIEEYNICKQAIYKNVEDSAADRDFLLSYIDDLYLNEWKWFSKWNLVLEYKQTTSKQLDYIQDAVTNIDEETKVKLWLNSTNWVENFLQKVKTNPWEMIQTHQNNIAWLLIWWLLAFLWFRGRWILSKLVWLTWWLLVAWSIPGFWDLLIDKWSDLIKSYSNKNNEWIKSKLYDNIPDLKFNEIKLQNIYDDLKSNDVFLSKDIKLLYIFENEKTKHDPNAIINELKKVFWDGVNTDNYLIYKDVFKEIIIQHKLQNWIDPVDANSNITIWKYLNTRSNSWLGIIPSAQAWSLEWLNVEAQTPETPKATNPEVWQENTIFNEKEKNNLILYFWIDSNELINTENELKNNWLNLDLTNILKNYKNYIENSFWPNLNIELKNKLIKIVKIKFSNLTSIISERISIVDQKIKDWEIKSEDRITEIQNQKWIINNNFNNQFLELNNNIFPSLYLYLNDIKKLTRNQRKSIEDMISRDIDEAWNFKAKLTDWLLDYFNDDFNDFELIDVNNKSFSDINIPKFENISLLNEKDKEIQDDAEFYYMAGLATLLVADAASFTWVWTIPWVVVWWVYWVWNAFSENDFIIDIFQELWYVDKNYLEEKWIWTRVISILWAIPLAWQWLRLATKSQRVTKYIQELSPEKLEKFNKIQKIFKNKLVEKTSNVNVWNFERASQTALNNIQNNKLLDVLSKVNWKINENKILNFLNKVWFMNWADGKKNILQNAYNISIWELLTLPKVVKQISVLAASKGWDKYNQSINLLKIIAFWNKEAFKQNWAHDLTRLWLLSTGIYSQIWDENASYEISKDILTWPISEEMISVLWFWLELLIDSFE